MITPEEQLSIRLIRYFISEMKFDVKKKHWDNQEITSELSLKLKYKADLSKIKNGKLSVTFFISVHLDDNSFVLKFTAVSNFNIKGFNENEELVENIAKRNAPAIVFPYIRATISSISQQLGFNSVILPTYNFTKIVDLSID